MWFKYVTRRLAVQVAQAWNFGWGKAMKKIYGVSVTDTLVFYDGKKTDYYVDEIQYKNYNADLYNLLKKKDFISTFHKEAKKTLETIEKKVSQKLSLDLSKLANTELLELYQNFILPNQTQFYVRMWSVFNIGEPLADTIKKYLSKKLFSEKEVTEYLLALSSPFEQNDILHERIDTLRFVFRKKRLNKENFKKNLSLHWQKYRHIPMFDFDHEPYTEKYFLEQIKLVKNPRQELDELQKNFSNRRKDFKRILVQLRPDKRFKSLLFFLKENVFLRDYRDMIRQKLNLTLRNFYFEISKRLGLDIMQTALLTNDEIMSYLKSEKKFPKKIVNERQKSYLLIQRGDRAEIYSGKDALIRAQEELELKKIKSVKTIKGIIGSSGKAKGTVKVVYTNKDLSKIKEGDVLVATMTRQDFITAIRKAIALVTDEGSVTAHAAIIARELKIPCVVATKVGTQVLKDGDMVEVDAYKGIVTRLNT